MLESGGTLCASVHSGGISRKERSSAGFQQLAMQIAITSNAIMKTEAQMLEAAEGLIANHNSDGSRYNSPAKRRAELVRMHQYTNENVCYEYSSGAVKKLSEPGIPTPDLAGLPASAGSIEGEGVDDGGLSQGVFLTNTGVWVKTDDRGRSGG